MWGLLHQAPEPLHELGPIVAMVPGPFERRVVDQKPDQLVADVRNRIRLDEVEEVLQVRPRSFDPDEVDEAFQSGLTDVSELP